MLFIPFIENAFKHGKKSGKGTIIIRIESYDSELYFLCINQKRELSETEEEIDSGIGIDNIKRRLELIFPQKHKLVISENEQEFRVNMMIKLAT